MAALTIRKSFCMDWAMDWARQARWAQGALALGPGALARAPPGPSPAPSPCKMISDGQGGTKILLKILKFP